MADKKEIKVFIASSSEMAEERRLMAQIFSDINELLPHVILRDIRFESAMAAGSIDGDVIQDDINRKLLDDSDVVIVMVFSKIGAFTREEYDRSMRKRKKVFLYFKEGFMPANETEAQTFADLFRFLSALNQENRILYSRFRLPVELRLDLGRNLLLFIREKYPFEDLSIVKLFQSLHLQDAAKNLLEGFALLPPNWYPAPEISRLLALPAPARETLADELKNLENIGIFQVADKRYKMPDVIRKSLVDGELPGKMFLTGLVNELIQRIDLQKDGVEINLKIEAIRFCEEFLSKLPNHQNAEIGRLKEAMAAFYLSAFGQDAPREYLDKCRLLLEQLLYEDDLDPAVDVVEGRRKRMLAEVYFSIGRQTKEADNRSRFVRSALRVLDEAGWNDAFPQLEKLRFNLLKTSLLLERDGPSETSRKLISRLFDDDPAYYDLISLTEKDLFVNYYLTSNAAGAFEQSARIQKKLIDLEAAEFGATAFRLWKPYRDYGQLLMKFPDKRLESKTYLLKSKECVVQGAPADADKPSILNSIDNLLAVWAAAADN